MTPNDNEGNWYLLLLLYDDMAFDPTIELFCNTFVPPHWFDDNLNLLYNHPYTVDSRVNQTSIHTVTASYYINSRPRVHEPLRR